MQTHFSKGASDSIAFVLSCPGRKEELAGHPAAGTTGRNLERLLLQIAPCLGGRKLTRSDVTIANAWKTVEYPAKTHRSEATDAEIRIPSNIERLAAEVQHVTELIVFCGDKAEIAAHELQKNYLPLGLPKFAYIKHLGTLGLNLITIDVNGSPIISGKKQLPVGPYSAVRHIQSANTCRRLGVVAASLAARIAAQ
jgi:hypothetical protein